MTAKHRISQESSEWIVSNSAGLVLAYFQHKHEAEDYALAQRRADEQSQVLGDFNRAAALRELAADFA